MDSDDPGVCLYRVERGNRLEIHLRTVQQWLGHSDMESNDAVFKTVVIFD
jgi:hypothetical protein